MFPFFIDFDAASLTEMSTLLMAGVAVVFSTLFCFRTGA